jgi:hypothetical protein
MNEKNQIMLLFLITLAMGLVAVSFTTLLPLARFGFTRGVLGSSIPVARVIEEAGAAGLSPPYANIEQELGYGTIIIVIALPFLLLFLYHLFGRERECSIPEYLSMVPDQTIKPWIVNLLFTGDPLDFDENGFYATLLDLHRQGIVHISAGSPGHVQIRILNAHSKDEYENRVLDFLKDLSRDDVLDMDTLRSNFEPEADPNVFDPVITQQRIRQARTYQLLISVPALFPSTRYIENGFKWILPLGSLGVVLYASSLLLAGAEAGNIAGAVIPALFASSLLAASLSTMWRIQENSLRRGVDKVGILFWMVFLSILALFPYYTEFLRANWILPTYGLLVLITGGVILIVAEKVTGPINRFRSAMVPFILSLFFGIVTISWLSQTSQAAITLVPPSLLSLVLVIQVMVAMVFPSTLIGRWRGKTYEERCKWDSFRAFLQDFSQIQQYAPQDLSMWGDWLVYGTALGVGDRVIVAMRDLRIQIPVANIAPALQTGFTPVANFPASSDWRLRVWKK